MRSVRDYAYRDQMNEVIKRVTERDIELPHEVTLHYLLYCLDLKSGKIEWQKEFFTGRPPGGRHPKNSVVSETSITDGKSFTCLLRTSDCGRLI